MTAGALVNASNLVKCQKCDGKTAHVWKNLYGTEESNYFCDIKKIQIYNVADISRMDNFIIKLMRQLKTITYNYR